jgi:1-acyl-sn-glycerol-3-phosphate acyltransferase
MRGTQAYHDALRLKHAYQTDPTAPRWIGDRLFGWSDLWFKARIVATVHHASQMAKRGAYDRPTWAEHAHRTVDVIEGCGGRLSISGLEHIAAIQGPMVIASNHMSLIETFVVPGILLQFCDVTVVLKESLMRYPLFGVILRAINPISVTRRDPREDLVKVLTEGERCLKNGRSVLLFPQATRTPGFTPSLFNSLGAKLARRANVPLVPLAIRTDFMGTGKLIRDLGPVQRSKPLRFQFGPAVPVTGNGRDAHQSVVNFITQRMVEWGVAIDSADRPVRNPEENGEPHA